MAIEKVTQLASAQIMCLENCVINVQERHHYEDDGDVDESTTGFHRYVLEPGYLTGEGTEDDPEVYNKTDYSEEYDEVKALAAFWTNDVHVAYAKHLGVTWSPS